MLSWLPSRQIAPSNMVPSTGVDAIHLLTEDLAWQDGRLLPSSRPGVGYIWNEGALRRFRPRQ